MRVIPEVMLSTVVSRRNILVLAIGLAGLVLFGVWFFGLRKSQDSVKVSGITTSNVVVESGKTDQNASFIKQALEEYKAVDVSTLADDKKLEHYMQLASLHNVNGNSQEAYDTYKKVDELSPNNPGVKFALAELALSLGDKLEAKTYYISAKDLYTKTKTETSQQSIDAINEKLATL